MTLLKSHNIDHCQVSGDTRFDRVKKIADRFDEVPLLREFVADAQVIVAGSTWKEDEAILAAYVKHSPAKVIIAPHEINKDHILHLQKLFPESILYSSLIQLLTQNEITPTSIWSSINAQEEKDIRKKLAGAKTLIIDTMGLLSKIYRYATVTYVGGGFKRGIHNTLEAVVYGKPVLFGLQYQKFKEAKDLIRVGAAFSVGNAEDLKTKMDHLLNDPDYLSQTGKAATDYVEKNTGATGKILNYIQENRLLTN